MFDWLGDATVFGKIGLKLGYWQMPIYLGDIQKTALKTWWGLYEYLVVPFGITNALTQFMGMMNDLFGEYLERFVLIFLDDILVYSQNIKEHIKYLRKVLGKLREHRLYVKGSKCEFVKSWIQFQGQQITSGGMNPKKDRTSCTFLGHA